MTSFVGELNVMVVDLGGREMSVCLVFRVLFGLRLLECVDVC